MRTIQCLLIAIAGAVSAAAPAQDASLEETTDSTLIVGVREAPPFAMRQGDGWTGLSIRAWERTADILDLEFRYEPAGLEEILSGVAAGRFDVGLGAYTVTPDRERRLDFSHPFHTSGYGLAVHAEPGGHWLAVAGRFLSLDFLKVALSLGALLLASGALVWIFERRNNPEQFEERIGPGLGSGFWWAAVTMTTVGYGDKAPRSLGGRIVALTWMFAAVMLISSFTAAITSSLTVNRLGSAVERLEHLESSRIGTLPGSASAEFLITKGYRTREYQSLGEALDAVAEGRVRGVLYDAPLIAHALNQRDDDQLRLLPHRIDRLDYSLVLQDGSPMRESINQALLETIHTASWQAAVARYADE